MSYPVQPLQETGCAVPKPSQTNVCTRVYYPLAAEQRSTNVSPTLVRMEEPAEISQDLLLVFVPMVSWESTVRLVGISFFFIFFLIRKFQIVAKKEGKFCEVLTSALYLERFFFAPSSGHNGPLTPVTLHRQLLCL